jgi:hypothetical protein
MWSTALLNDTEWPVLHVFLDLWIINLATDETVFSGLVAYASLAASPILKENEMS